MALSTKTWDRTNYAMSFHNSKGRGVNVEWEMDYKCFHLMKANLTNTNHNIRPYANANPFPCGLGPIFAPGNINLFWPTRYRGPRFN